jgi:hypothetical protein
MSSPNHSTLELCSPDRHGLRDGCLLKWLILAISSGSGLAFIGLHYKCSGNAYLEPVDTCYRVTSASCIYLACWLSHHCLQAFESAPFVRQLRPQSASGSRATGESGIYVERRELGSSQCLC